MIKRELKVNFKSFSIWLIILMGLFTFVFLIYPSMMTDEKMELLNQSLKAFPEEVLKAFNMDISNVDSAYGWFKTEGLIFVLLICGVYSSTLGANIVLKEESDKTIEYLNTLPISRSKVFLSKYFVGLVYVILLVLLITLYNLFGFSIIEEIDKLEFIKLSITPIFTSVVLYSLSIFIATFFSKTKKVFGISLGIVFISYFLNILAGMSDKTEWFKYFSVFTLADIRNVIVNSSINIVMPLISIILSIILLVLGLIKYNKKEFV